MKQKFKWREQDQPLSKHNIKNPYKIKLKTNTNKVIPHLLESIPNQLLSKICLQGEVYKQNKDILM